MKKEDLRPVQYKEFLKFDTIDGDFKAIYSDYQNGWFHGWELLGNSTQGTTMGAVIESQSGSIVSIAKSHFKFTDRD